MSTVDPGEVWELTFGDESTIMYLTLGSSHDPSVVRLLNLESGALTMTFVRLMLNPNHGRWRRVA